MTDRTPNVRVALYNRVSTDEQDPTKGMDRLQAWAKANGKDVRHAATEIASTRSHVRPERDRIIALAKKGAFDAVAVEKLDRWGRSVIDVHGTLAELKAHGVGFIATTQGIDTTQPQNAVSGAFLGLLAVFAEFEREIIRERTRAAMAAAKARGKHVGRPRKREPFPNGEKGALSLPVPTNPPFPEVVQND